MLLLRASEFLSFGAALLWYILEHLNFVKSWKSNMDEFTLSKTLFISSQNNNWTPQLTPLKISQAPEVLDLLNIENFFHTLNVSFSFSYWNQMFRFFQRNHIMIESLTLSWRSPLHIETSSLIYKSTDWFLYDMDLRLKTEYLVISSYEKPLSSIHNKLIDWLLYMNNGIKLV